MGQARRSSQAAHIGTWHRDRSVPPRSTLWSLSTVGTKEEGKAHITDVPGGTLRKLSPSEEGETYTRQVPFRYEGRSLQSNPVGNSAGGEGHYAQPYPSNDGEQSADLHIQ